MSVIERTIAFFSPKTALKRQVNQNQIDILNSIKAAGALHAEFIVR